MTRALIAEDEPLLAAALRAELKRLWPELDTTSVATNGPDALAHLQRDAPDVAFLDIRMPGMTGIEVAEALAEEWDDPRPVPLLVFVTAYDEFAVKAFDQAAVDYLLKPVQTARLAAALERVRRRLAERRGRPSSAAALPSGDATSDRVAGASTDETSTPDIEALASQLRTLLAATGTTGAAAIGLAPPAEPLRTLRAGVGDTVRMIPIDRVILLQAADKYVSVLTAEHESLIREPLKDLLPRLDPSRFAQIHRGTVVNLEHVEAAVRDDQGKVSLRLRGRPEKPVVSRLYTHLFRAM